MSGDEHNGIANGQQSLLRRLLPFLDWFPMTAAGVRADLIAGLTVAMVLIPQSMAYAQLAGLPPVCGLYAAFLPTIVGALWGSSRHLSTGPVAMTSLLTAASLMPLAAAGTERHLALAATLAVMVGIIRIALGVLRLGFVANFIAHPVVCGFTNAGALIIAASQIDSLLGLQTGNQRNLFEKFWLVIFDLRHTDLPVAAFGLGAVALMLCLRRRVPRWPAALLTAGVATAICGLLALRQGQTLVPVVGAVPRGLPRLSLSLLEPASAARLFPAAAVLVLVGFMEAASVSKALAERSRQRLNLNQELIGQGLASLAAGCTQGFPVSGSFSRSALNHAAGARTGLSSVTAGLAVLLTLLFFTPLLYYLPLAVLGAIIVIAVLRLLDWRSMRQAWRAHPHDGVTAWATFGLTLYLAPHLEFGILGGALLALALYLYRTMTPRVVVLGLHPDGTLRDARTHRLAIDRAHPAIRFGGRLYFANAAAFEEAVLDVLADYPQARHILIMGDGINEMDATGAHMLRHLVQRLREIGVTLVFVELKLQIAETLARTGLDRLIRPENMFRTYAAAHAAVEERERAAAGTPAAPPPPNASAGPHP